VRGSRPGPSESLVDGLEGPMAHSRSGITDPVQRLRRRSKAGEQGPAPPPACTSPSAPRTPPAPARGRVASRDGAKPTRVQTLASLRNWRPFEVTRTRLGVATPCRWSHSPGSMAGGKRCRCGRPTTRRSIPWHDGSHRTRGRLTEGECRTTDGLGLQCRRRRPDRALVPLEPPDRPIELAAQPRPAGPR
jgi:hypothetical protein